MVGELGAHSAGSSTNLGQFWDVSIMSLGEILKGVDASGGWGIDCGWDSGITYWANWGKSKVIAYIMIVSLMSEVQKHSVEDEQVAWIHPRGVRGYIHLYF